MRRRFYLSVLFTLILSGYVLAASAITSNDLLGVWKKKTAVLGTPVTYVFQKDHEFEFIQTYRDGSGGKKTGAWQMGERMCWVGDGGIKGNLMIHIETDQCCHLAYFLGKNLILSNIGGSRLSWSPCADRVLVRER
jgi:hypothetical protein